MCVEVETDDAPDLPTAGVHRVFPVALGEVDVVGPEGVHEDAPGRLEVLEDTSHPGEDDAGRLLRRRDVDAEELRRQLIHWSCAAS